MIVAKFAGGGRTTTAYGLTQWDYGQELALECAEIDIPDRTEVNFYQGELSSIGYIKGNHVMVPDLMLQAQGDITAYVYIRSPSSGETILSIRMPVSGRPKPDNYVLPEYRDYLRLIPPGGKPGQVLAKKTETDYDTKWADGGSDTLEPLTDEDIDAMCV